MQQGILKIDFLLLQTMFDGFVIDDRMVHERTGLPSPKNHDDRRKLGAREGQGGSWRDGQGGNGKCVLVLLCQQRGVPGGGGSAGASPNTRARDMNDASGMAAPALG
jgi:hypothetical protein